MNRFTQEAILFNKLPSAVHLLFVASWPTVSASAATILFKEISLSWQSHRACVIVLFAYCQWVLQAPKRRRVKRATARPRPPCCGWLGENNCYEQCHLVGNTVGTITCFELAQLIQIARFSNWSRLRQDANIHRGALLRLAFSAASKTGRRVPPSPLERCLRGIYRRGHPHHHQHESFRGMADRSGRRGGCD
jgi:hypothetical protein